MYITYKCYEKVFKSYNIDNNTQKYLKNKKTSIGITLFNKHRKLVYREWTDKMDTLKQKQSIIPNIIHSLDASHLSSLINSAEKDNFGPIVTIHDCFGTLPNLMGTLEYRVKKEFILLYSESKFLSLYHERFLQNLKDNHFEIKFDEQSNKSYVLLEEELFEIPEQPQQGELDLEKIIKSKYMIS